MSAQEQGYPVIRLLDSNNVECFVVPSYGGVPGVNTQGSCVFMSRVAVTNAQLLALHTTPVVLIAAPNPVVAQPNVIIIPIGLSIHYLYKTAAFTLNGGTLRLSYGPVANANYLCADQSGILTNTANEINPSIALTYPGVLTEANGLNQAIYLVNTVANFTVGGGSIVVGVTYSLMNM